MRFCQSRLCRSSFSGVGFSLLCPGNLSECSLCNQFEILFSIRSPEVIAFSSASIFEYWENTGLNTGLLQGCYFTLSTRLRKHVFVSHHGTLGETLQPMQCGQLISMLILLATASQSFKITREERLDHICYVRHQISFLLSDLVAVAQAYID